MQGTMEREYLLAHDTIDQNDLEELIGWLKGNPWLTQGPLTREFEASWSRWLGREHSTYVNSGSSANLLMYYALELSGRLKNRKVVVPAVAWATTVAPAIQLGFTPVMCDADPDTYGLDPNQLEEICRKHHPGAVILVHVLGVPCDVEAILTLKQRYGFALMEDACAATGSRYDGRQVGTFGDMSSFSFYFGHHLSTIEGGMVSTDDPALDTILKKIRSHGWAKDVTPDHEAELMSRYDVIPFNRTFTFYEPGFNVRSTDLNARIGLMQMKKVDRVVARRAENHRAYQQRFLDSEAFGCQRNDRAQISSISFAALASSGEHRERVAAALMAARIETRPLGGGNMSRQPFWSDRYGSRGFPMADRIHETSFHLPNNPRITLQDVQFICDTVLAVR